MPTANDPNATKPTATAAANTDTSSVSSSSGQKPTPGRIVTFMNGDQPEAAMIVGVHSDTVCTLRVWNAGGTPRVEASADLGTGPGTWRWPTRL
ncbi:MAG: hypothetical protein QOI20_3261 [Acidimicrobiaceae bacterium]|jgi:hypothetical protein|nr:hypothetical protein [Acidimicrobiaceae bacterium]